MLYGAHEPILQGKFWTTVAAALRRMKPSLSEKLAIDLGESNTLIYSPNRGIVLNEPSVIAFDRSKGQVIACGREAKDLIGRAPETISVVRPLRDGMIADSDAAALMLSTFVHQALGRRWILGPTLLVCLPCEITQGVRRAAEHAVRGLKARAVRFIEKPRAVAVAAGINPRTAQASMVVDLGGGSTDIAVLSFGMPVRVSSARVGGMKLDQAIAHYLRRERYLEIGELTAEKIKLRLASVSAESDEQTMMACGRSLKTRLPAKVTLSGREVRAAIEPVIQEIIAAVRYALEELPPEIAADLLESGIVLSGGGAQLPGLADRLARELNLDVKLIANPALAAILGAGHLLHPESPPSAHELVDGVQGMA